MRIVQKIGQRSTKALAELTPFKPAFSFSPMSSFAKAFPRFPKMFKEVSTATDLWVIGFTPNEEAVTSREASRAKERRHIVHGI